MQIALLSFNFSLATQGPIHNKIMGVEDIDNLNQHYLDNKICTSPTPKIYTRTLFQGHFAPAYTLGSAKNLSPLYFPMP